MSTPLGRWIADRIAQSGPVPFARFMQWCLYHPQYGYYTAGRVRVGADTGDFTTAPHVSRLFAGCLARFAGAVDRALGCPDPFALVEGGPGEGRLALDLLDALQRQAPDLYRRTHYYLDEISPVLLRRQRELLAPHAAHVHPGRPDAPAVGLYLSNELVDALPVHRLTLDGGALREVWVDRTGDGWREVLLPPAVAETGEEGAALLDTDGYQVEVRPAAGAWLAAAEGCLRRGCLVTVDYGDFAARLFGPRHPHGTCVAYRGHHQESNLFAAPGEQDLTAQVDFTALQRLGTALGLEAAPLLKQREFLMATGLLLELEAVEASDRPELEKLELRQQVAPLLFPGAGMGDVFKVLVQAKGLALAELPLTPEHGFPG